MNFVYIITSHKALKTQIIKIYSKYERASDALKEIIKENHGEWSDENVVFLDKLMPNCGFTDKPVPTWQYQPDVNSDLEYYTIEIEEVLD